MRLAQRKHRARQEGKVTDLENEVQTLVRRSLLPYRHAPKVRHSIIDIIGQHSQERLVLLELLQQVGS